jgi:outer membrane protein assembly factor BamC
VTVFLNDAPQGVFPISPLRAASLALALSLAGCSTFENMVSGDKVDYRSSGGKTAGLEVPPDLTQLSRDSRYQQQSGTISASTFQAPSANPTITATVAPASQGELRIERTGNQRWIVTNMTPEQVWPQLQSFWKERGFNLASEQAEVGVMETDWAENRAKIPGDFIRNTLGRVIDSLYSTGERDKFRTRVERTATGSEIYISHRGMVEVYSNSQKDSTVWQPRPSDPQLEAEFLQRVMIRLGSKEEQAKTAVAAAATPQPARARLVEGQGAATLQVDDNFDRAWRRVGVALDRSGFTVEDRDRAQGIYFVRYINSSHTNKEEPGLLGRLFSFGKTKDDPTGLVKYRVVVKSDGDRSTVAVFNAQGGPENGEAGKRIVKLLVDDLK